MIRADHDQPEFSSGPFTRLIKEIGHVGEITVSTVKPLPTTSVPIDWLQPAYLTAELTQPKNNGICLGGQQFLRGWGTDSAPA